MTAEERLADAAKRRIAEREARQADEVSPRRLPRAIVDLGVLTPYTHHIHDVTRRRRTGSTSWSKPSR